MTEKVPKTYQSRVAEIKYDPARIRGLKEELFRYVEKENSARRKANTMLDIYEFVKFYKSKLIAKSYDEGVVKSGATLAELIEGNGKLMLSIHAQDNLLINPEGIYNLCPQARMQ